MADPSRRPGDRPSERRAHVRTAVVWSALQDLLERPGVVTGETARILDIGGGTGGFAVPLAGLGHRVEVVDPSPDALASLGRRAAEEGVTDLVTGRQGDLDDLGPGDPAADGGSGEGFDVVLCHGVLEMVDDPAAALRNLAGALRPGGTLSLLVAQRHAAVVAQAMAGHFAAARELLDAPLPRAGAPGPADRSGHRYTATELTGLLSEAGFEVRFVHGVRVFSDLVPGSLLDAEPGAAASLVELERAVSERPEYLPLASQVHLLATR